ncbi:putative DNA modification/repair radical SAM protein [Devosia sp. WQ 349]|uniref:putative DNA modification/repair radical SAM protein n=1 Tax=Devosia sp. WQ 349K1 TaxID=2800329 RepID=UPI001908EECE|nr:putative DNA modification/repair radical SAM protein [Devosia sp. WQ 349K1]MBK1794787.1 putative DNA modification/repair radical SAM protein [Devosia sp. WQ 349K1]
MAPLTLNRKLAILADAAKYDASCASSGTAKRNSSDGKGIGSTEGSGICHSYAPDGRCISLLKLLLTNFCIYDCAYCINRSSSNVQRARFSVEEVVNLTLDFYRRNYIEGLFLSSGIIKSPDHTMEEMVRVAKALREVHHFKGYIHLKVIPNAAPELLIEAGRWADRLSTNIELPTDVALETLAPEKRPSEIRTAMANLRGKLDEAKPDKKPLLSKAKKQKFAPAGQSTQMIVGADGANDSAILTRAAGLYSGYRLKRVYYSAFSPIPDASSRLPLKAPPLMREHRLYQADWLIRFYGFDVPEIVSGGDDQGLLDLAIDPKLAWALKQRQNFPVDVNRADREMLLRVPGLGVRSVDRIIASRRFQRLRLEDVARMAASIDKVRPFIAASDWTPGGLTDDAKLRERLAPPPEQMSLF